MKKSKQCLAKGGYVGDENITLETPQAQYNPFNESITMKGATSPQRQYQVQTGGAPKPTTSGFRGLSYPGIGAGIPIRDIENSLSMSELGSLAARNSGKVAGGLAAAPELYNTIRDVNSGSLDGRGKALRVAEGAARIGSSLAGAEGGAMLGAMAGPAAPITVPLGAMAGGVLGYYSPTLINKATNALTGRNNKLPSEIAGYNYAKGGIIKGPGTGRSDSIAANLVEGDAIIPAARVKLLGEDFLNEIKALVPDNEMGEQGEVVPAQVSNGEFRFTAQEVKFLGKKFIDDLIYGESNPQEEGQESPAMERGEMEQEPQEQMTPPNRLGKPQFAKGGMAKPCYADGEDNVQPIPNTQGWARTQFAEANKIAANNQALRDTNKQFANQAEDEATNQANALTQRHNVIDAGLDKQAEQDVKNAYLKQPADLSYANESPGARLLNGVKSIGTGAMDVVKAPIRLGGAAFDAGRSMASADTGSMKLGAAPKTDTYGELVNYVDSIPGRVAPILNGIADKFSSNDTTTSAPTPAATIGNTPNNTDSGVAPVANTLQRPPVAQAPAQSTQQPADAIADNATPSHDTVLTPFSSPYKARLPNQVANEQGLSTDTVPTKNTNRLEYGANTNGLKFDDGRGDTGSVQFADGRQLSPESISRLGATIHSDANPEAAAKRAQSVALADARIADNNARNAPQQVIGGAQPEYIEEQQRDPAIDQAISVLSQQASGHDLFGDKALRHSQEAAARLLAGVNERTHQGNEYKLGQRKVYNERNQNLLQAQNQDAANRLGYRHLDVESEGNQIRGKYEGERTAMEQDYHNRQLENELSKPVMLNTYDNFGTVNGQRAMQRDKNGNLVDADANQTPYTKEEFAHPLINSQAKAAYDYGKAHPNEQLSPAMAKLARTYHAYAGT